MYRKALGNYFRILQLYTKSIKKNTQYTHILMHIYIMNTYVCIYILVSVNNSVSIQRNISLNEGQKRISNYARDMIIKQKVIFH